MLRKKLYIKLKDTTFHKYCIGKIELIVDFSINLHVYGWNKIRETILYYITIFFYGKRV